MKNEIRFYRGAGIAGAAAGIINGLFGAGGGMILVPLLSWLTALQEEEIFPVSVISILPICMVSLITGLQRVPFSWNGAIPYLLGSAIGGTFAGIYSGRIPTIWLHRALGLVILWRGFRYLW